MELLLEVQNTSEVLLKAILNLDRERILSSLLGKVILKKINKTFAGPSNYSEFLISFYYLDTHLECGSEFLSLITQEAKINSQAGKTMSRYLDRWMFDPFYSKF